MEINSSNSKIYIYTHKDFKIPDFVESRSDLYEIIAQNGCNISNTKLTVHSDSDGISLDNYKKRPYGELSGIYWLWKNIDLPEWVGFCQYRRYLDFDIDADPSIYYWYNFDGAADVYTVVPYYVKFLPYQYALCHNINDFNIVSKYMNKKWPQYSNVNTDFLYAYNLIYMKKERFIEYCEFMFDVLDYFDRSLLLYSTEDYIRHISTYDYSVKQSTSCNKPDYQLRLDGFIAERLTTLFIENGIGRHNTGVRPLKFIEDC